MYVTRPLSLYRRSPESLSLAPPEGPNSGYLVLLDEESETTCCFGLCKNRSIKHLPLPQNKDLTVWYSASKGQRSVVYFDDFLFIPVLNQPLSSNQYYVIRRQGKHKGQACTNSKEEDKGTFCCCNYIRDVKPRPLDPSDIYQQFEIIRKKSWGFYAKSIAPDAFPPHFLRRKYWGLDMRTPRHYHLEEALGLDPSLRAHLPEPNLTLSNPSSRPNNVIGKWYSPFVFVKEGHMEPKDQMNISTFYEVTLEQRWDKIFGCQNVENEYSKVVPLDVFVEREDAFVYGRKAVWDERNLENGMIWFKSCDDQGGVEEVRVGLSLVILERMKWEQERVGWVGEDEKGVRVERREEFGGTGSGWREFGCFVLVERFVLKRMDGSVVLTYDFKHNHQIRCIWA